jgi:hypothetical protein
MTQSLNNLRCSECGAANREGTTKCWLCGAATLADDIPYAELVPEPARLSGQQFTLSGLFILITLVAVVSGVWVQEPGAGFSLAVIGVPALLATLIRTARKRQRGETVTRADQFVTLLLSAAATFGILMMLMVAAFVAFFVYCLFEMSKMGI